VRCAIGGLWLPINVDGSPSSGAQLPGRQGWGIRNVEATLRLGHQRRLVSRYVLVGSYEVESY
jgi:hypothetical protein